MVTVSDSLSSADREALLLDCKAKIDAVRTDLASIDSNAEEVTPEFMRELVERLQSVRRAQIH